jgi:hypothetical protein
MVFEVMQIILTIHITTEIQLQYYLTCPWINHIVIPHVEKVATLVHLGYSSNNHPYLRKVTKLACPNEQPRLSNFQVAPWKGAN